MIAPQHSQSSLILQYYKMRPNEPVPHSEAVDWAIAEWLSLTGKIFRDPDRAVRDLSQKGILIKVEKGVYMYDPDHVRRNDLYDFTPQQKAEILLRDNYRCVVCGNGKAEGVDLQVDHVKPKEKGGRATIGNGQTLCGQHNFIKKNYSQTEAGKRFFLKMREQAVSLDDANMIAFCDDVLAMYQKYGYDTRIS
ncbi:MAG TPA: HNH endonuclease [Candidatus Saccharimonadales bacterium]|nr:HNH endonuclease [Candidatus Saccharimonadales bacterium]